MSLVTARIEARRACEQLETRLRSQIEAFARSLRAAVNWSYDWTNGSSEADKARNDALNEVANAIDLAFDVDSQSRKADAEPDHTY